MTFIVSMPFSNFYSSDVIWQDAVDKNKVLNLRGLRCRCSSTRWQVRVCDARQQPFKIHIARQTDRIWHIVFDNLPFKFNQISQTSVPKIKAKQLCVQREETVWTVKRLGVRGFTSSSCFRSIFFCACSIPFGLYSDRTWGASEIVEARRWRTAVITTQRDGISPVIVSWRTKLALK